MDAVAATDTTAPGPSKRGRRNLMPSPVDPALLNTVVWQQLDTDFEWYDSAANRCRLGYVCTRAAALLVGSAVTVLAATRAPAALTASLAATVVVAEGLQQLFQFHTNWISYRTTAESLRQYAFLCAAGVPPFDDPSTRLQRLAEAERDLVSRESGTWAATMTQLGGAQHKGAEQ
jgi:hypothetical protein